jgi:hypothetical protein
MASCAEMKNVPLSFSYYAGLPIIVIAGGAVALLAKFELACSMDSKQAVQSILIS